MLGLVGMMGELDERKEMMGVVWFVMNRNDWRPCFQEQDFVKAEVLLAVQPPRSQQTQQLDCIVGAEVILEVQAVGDQGHLLSDHG